MLIEEFQLGELLGTGSYGQVYKASHIETRKVCAIKILTSEPSQEVLDKIMKEMNIMIQCESEHIVKCFGSEINDYGICLFLEYCKGSVADLVKASPNLRLSEYHIASILEPALRGLDYLHAHKKIHRDIKAANILINERGDVKLGDFGVSAELIHTYADKDTMIGSPFWMSPQIVNKNKYNSKTDIWSLGITAIQLAQRTPPYSHLHPIRAMFAIQNNPPKQLSDPSLWSSQFNSFVRKCLTVEPSRRPTARELLQHPFIVTKSKSPDILKELIDSNQSFLKKQKRQLKVSKQAHQNSQFNESGTMIQHSKLEGYQPFWEGQQRNQPPEDFGTLLQKQDSSQQASFMKYFKKPQQTQEQKYLHSKQELQNLTNQMNAQISAIRENYRARMGRYQEVVKTYESSKVKEIESNDRRLSLRKPTLDKCFKVKREPLHAHPASGNNNNNYLRVRTQMNEDKETLTFESAIRKDKQRESQGQYYNMFMKNSKERQPVRLKHELNQSNKTIDKIHSIIKTQQFNKTTKQLNLRR